LRRLSKASGLHILTVTGNYAADDYKHLPPEVYTVSAEALGQRWIDEWTNGIDGTGIRPGFIKLGFNGGVFSSPNTYRNELFLIGGYRLLRGFDEQSILASQYAVGTLEYRYLVGLNSFLFTFLDAGWAKNNVPGYTLNNSFLGAGLGMAFETKAGIFNISYALGKRDNTSFNFHDSKIHLGYVSFF